MNNHIKNIITVLIISSSISISHPASAKYTTFAEGVVDNLKGKMPLRFNTGDVATSARAEGNDVVLDLKSANGTYAKSVRSTAMSICQMQGLQKFFDTGGSFIIHANAPAGREYRIKINPQICSGKNLHFTTVPLPMPELKTGAVVNINSEKTNIYQTCNEWKTRLISDETNEEWLKKFSHEEIEKDEFETTVEYEIRKTKADNQYANISFKFENTDLRYDADNQLMQVEMIKRKQVLLSKNLGQDRYIGTNVFGLSAEVTRHRRTILSVDFQNPLAVFQSELQIKMQRSKAMTFKSDGRVYVLGKIIGTDTSAGRGVPTINSPTETFVTERIINLEPVCVATVIDGKAYDWNEVREMTF